MYCPRCGEKQKENVEYCSKCGISLKKGYSKEDEKEIRKDTIKKIVRFIVCFIYGFCFNIVGLFLFFLLRKDEKEVSLGILLGSVVSVLLFAFFTVSRFLRYF